MRAFFLRDLAVMVSRPSFVLTIGVHAGVIAAFEAIWGNGVPLLPGGNAYEQQRLIQWGLLAVLLPWTAARCLPREGAAGQTCLALATAVPPSRALVARIAAAFAGLSIVVAGGFPLVVLAQQISAVPLTQAVQGLVGSLGAAAVASASTVSWNLVQDDRLTAWFGATATTVGLLVGGAGLLPATAAPWLFWAAPIAAGAAAARRADVSLRYLSEEPA